jgi:phosphatidylglycerol---prolipoprotein diacylglyceryl transferase
LPWAAHFPHNRALSESQVHAGYIAEGAATLPVHPTQIYLAGLNLLTFFVLYLWVRGRKRFHGEVFAWLLIMKGVFRSIVEIWRDDERGVLFGWLSTSQMLSVPLIALGIFLLVRQGRVGRDLPPGAAGTGPTAPVPLPTTNTNTNTAPAP